MKLTINKNRTTTATGTWGTINENRYEIIDFEFPEDLEDYNKRIVYYLDDKRVWDTIVENKAYITNAIAKYDRVKAYVWLTKGETITLKYVCDGTEEGDYYFTYNNTDYYFTMPEVAENDELIYDVATSTLKLGETTITTSSTGTGTELTFETIIDAEEDFRTKLFELEFYENENAEGIVPTEEQVDGFNTMLTAMNNKINEINIIETNIESAEADRVLAEQGRVNAENTRVRNEETRQENEQTRQTQEADRERRTDAAIADIQDKTAEYNANATAKTNAFNQNAVDKTNDFNSNAESKTTSFNTNASNKTTDFNTNASNKVTNFNTNATNKTNAFDSNASSKTTAFNENATNKTTDFNTNATNKTTTFDNNATSKTGDFNDNATAKTTAFNENAIAKTEDFDTHVSEITTEIEELQQEVEELSENMPWAETEQGKSLDVTDAARYSKNKIKVFGNIEQASTSISEGDEYDSPSPDHPQTIHIATGNNTIHINNTDYPLNLGSLELYRTPNYADYIYKEGDNWYKYNAIEKIIITEATARTWYKSSISSNTYSVFQAAGDVLTKYPPSTLDVFCDKFIAKINAGGAIINGEGISTNSRSSASDTTPKPIRIAILKSRLCTDDADGLKTWLSNNNLTVYIALNTPTTTQITDTTLIEQLETIYNKIATVKGTNHVTITATDIAPYITLNYMQDLPSKLDNLASRMELLEG